LPSSFRRSLQLAKELEEKVKEERRKADEEVKNIREKEKKGV
jgi:hypothetical protein